MTVHKQVVYVGGMIRIMLEYSYCDKTVPCTSIPPDSPKTLSLQTSRRVAEKLFASLMIQLQLKRIILYVFGETIGKWFQCDFGKRGVKNRNDESNGCCIVIIVGNRIVS